MAFNSSRAELVACWTEVAETFLGLVELDERGVEELLVIIREPDAVFARRIND